MAFIVAGLVALGTMAFAALQVMGEMMRPSGSDLTGTAWTLGVGLTAAALIAASHWLNIGW